MKKEAQSAIAVLAEHGQVEFYVDKNAIGIRVRYHLTGFRPHSTHAIHVHEFGDVRKGCASLGGHFNPMAKNHGSIHTTHRHAGDLINNFTTDHLGNFHLDILDDHLTSIEELWGRSIVIHEHRDDMGLKAMLTNDHVLIGYNQMSDQEVIQLCITLGYHSPHDQVSPLACRRKLNAESLKTGNAGKRLACAIIGRAI